MEAPDFWDNAEASQMKMKQLKSLKDDIETYHNLETQMEDMETMIEMGYEENDPEIVPEIQEMLDEFQARTGSGRGKKSPGAAAASEAQERGYLRPDHVFVVISMPIWYCIRQTGNPVSIYRKKVKLWLS